MLMGFDECLHIYRRHGMQLSHPYIRVDIADCFVESDFARHRTVVIEEHSNTKGRLFHVQVRVNLAPVNSIELSRSALHHAKIHELTT